MPLSRSAVIPLIRRALREDQAARDLTSAALLPRTLRLRARIVARTAGICAGLPVAQWTFRARDATLQCRLRQREGRRVRRGDVLMTVEGCARSILAAERTALNFLGHLSGIATLTRQFVDRAGRPAQILDTRKTLPGLRMLEKYAVRAGGGASHRGSLAGAILIKTNHLRALDRVGIHAAVERGRARRPRRFVEVEVRTLTELKAALAARPDAILLDNWAPWNLRRAVALRGGSRPLLEASGGVTLENVRSIAQTGVDQISIGRLTHSAPALDLALEVV